MFTTTPSRIGFAAGILACLLLAGVANVVFKGQGFGDPPPRGAVVYPNW